MTYPNPYAGATPPGQWGPQAAQAAQQYVNQVQPAGWNGQPTAPAAPVAPPQSASFDQDMLEFGAPTGGGSLAPAPRHWVGRTVILVPKRIDENANYEGNPRPTAYYDLYVIDGGPIPLGDSESRSNPRPPTHTVETPAFFPDAMCGNDLIVNEVRNKIGPDGRPTALLVGVGDQSSKGRKPYVLTKMEKDYEGRERPDAEQRKARAREIYSAHRAGTWNPPRPVPLGQQVPQGPQGVVQYQQAPMVPQQPVQQAQPVASGGYPPAPGWDPTMWASFTPDQQAGIWAQAQAGMAPASGAPAAAPMTPQGPGW